MNKKRKKTVLPLDYQVESFFKKVLYLNNKLNNNKIENKTKTLNIDNLDFETLVYKGMRQYEELISNFKIKSPNKNIKKEKKIKNKRLINNKENNLTETFPFDKNNKIDNEYYKYNEYSLDKKEKYNLNDDKIIKKKINFKNKNYEERNKTEVKCNPFLRFNREEKYNKYLRNNIQEKKNMNKYNKTYNANDEYNDSDSDEMINNDEFHKYKNNNYIKIDNNDNKNKQYRNYSKHEIEYNNNNKMKINKFYSSRNDNFINSKKNNTINYIDNKSFDNNQINNHIFRKFKNENKIGSEISDKKGKNKWMKPKTNITNSILSKNKDSNSKNYVEESQSRNSWMKKTKLSEPMRKLDLNESLNNSKNTYIKNDYYKNSKIVNINYGNINDNNMYINFYKTESNINNEGINNEFEKILEGKKQLKKRINDKEKKKKKDK